MQATALLLHAFLAFPTPQLRPSLPLPPRERAVLHGVVGRNETIPNGSLLRIDLHANTVQDVGPILGRKELYYPADGTPDPDGRHFWIAQTQFGGSPAAWRTWLQRIDLETRKEDRWVPTQGTVLLDGLVFAPDGQLLAANNARSPVELVRVNLQTGAVTHVGDIDQGSVRGMGFRGNDLWAVFEKRTDPPLHVEELLKLSTTGGSILARVALPLGPHHHATALTFSPSGRCIVAIVTETSGEEHRLCQVDLATGALTTLGSAFIVPHGMGAAVR